MTRTELFQLALTDFIKHLTELEDETKPQIPLSNATHSFNCYNQLYFMLQNDSELEVPSELWGKIPSQFKRLMMLPFLKTLIANVKQQLEKAGLELNLEKINNFDHQTEN